MSIACSEPELQELLASVAFTRKFGFTVHEITDVSAALKCRFSQFQSAREVS
jgi:hypothetical protein